MRHAAFFLSTWLLVAPFAASAQTDSLLASDSSAAAAAVLAQNRRLTSAFVQRDLAELDQLIDSTAVQVTSNGVATKSEWLAGYSSGQKRFDSRPTSSWRRIPVYGELAVTTALATLPMSVRGELRTYAIINSRIWALEHGQWILVHAQNTPTAGAPDTLSSRSAHEGNRRHPIPSAREVEVLAANSRIESIDLQPDSAAAVLAYADDFLNITANGDVRSKSERLKTLLSREPAYERIQDSDLRVRAFADAALVSGRSLVRVRLRGAVREGAVRFARVFVRRDGEWRLVFQQLTPSGSAMMCAASVIAVE